MAKLEGVRNDRPQAAGAHPASRLALACLKRLRRPDPRTVPLLQLLLTWLDRLPAAGTGVAGLPGRPEDGGARAGAEAAGGPGGDAGGGLPGAGEGPGDAGGVAGAGGHLDGLHRDLAGAKTIPGAARRLAENLYAACSWCTPASAGQPGSPGVGRPSPTDRPDGQPVDPGREGSRSRPADPGESLYESYRPALVAGEGRAPARHAAGRECGHVRRAAAAADLPAPPSPGHRREGDALGGGPGVGRLRRAVPRAVPAGRRHAVRPGSVPQSPRGVLRPDFAATREPAATGTT
jgi:hypothetical protein